MPELKELFDLRYTAAAEYLEQFTHPWQALEGIEDLIRELGAGLGADYLEVRPQVWVHRCRHRGAALRVHPGQRPGGSGLRGRQFRGTEECDSL